MKLKPFAEVFVDVYFTYVYFLERCAVICMN